MESSKHQQITRQQLVEYVQHVMLRRDWTQTELAKTAGMDPSSLSKFLGDESRMLSYRNIRRIEQASGLALTGIARPVIDQSIGISGFREIEATPFDQSSNTDKVAVIRFAIGQSNAVDAWVLRSAALEGLGYFPGDVVLVDLNRQPKPGDIVCAQIVDWQRGGAETVFRHYQPPCLLAVTNDRKLLQPYIIDNGATVIKGTVSHLFRFHV